MTTLKKGTQPFFLRFKLIKALFKKNAKPPSLEGGFFKSVNICQLL